MGKNHVPQFPINEYLSLGAQNKCPHFSEGRFQVRFRLRWCTRTIAHLQDGSGRVWGSGWINSFGDG